MGLVTQSGFGSEETAEFSEHANAVAISGFAILLGTLIMIAAGIGIIASKKWGFIAAIVGTAVLLIG